MTRNVLTQNIQKERSQKKNIMIQKKQKVKDDNIEQ